MPVIQTPGTRGSGGVPEFDQRGSPFERMYNGDGVGGTGLIWEQLSNKPSRCR